jgi:hypothetical protein
MFIKLVLLTATITSMKDEFCLEGISLYPLNSCGYGNLSMVGRWFPWIEASLNFISLVLMILGLFGRVALGT